MGEEGGGVGVGTERELELDGKKWGAEWSGAGWGEGE